MDEIEKLVEDLWTKHGGEGGSFVGDFIDWQGFRSALREAQRMAYEDAIEIFRDGMTSGQIERALQAKADSMKGE